MKTLKKLLRYLKECVWPGPVFLDPKKMEKRKKEFEKWAKEE
jgi:hypothetical protein